MPVKERSVSRQSEHPRTYAIYRHLYAHPLWRKLTHFGLFTRRRVPKTNARKNSYCVPFVRRQVDRRSKVGTQMAEPQRVAATTTVHSPANSGAEDASSSSVRKYLGNRSPSGQSPVTKSRKTPHNANLSISGGASGQSSNSTKDSDKDIGSPKSRTWKGLVARQFRKIQGTPSAQASNYVVLPEGASIGVPLALCPMVSEIHLIVCIKNLSICD